MTWLAVSGVLIVGVARLPIEVTIAAALLVIGLSVLVRSHYDAAQLAIFNVAALAIVPASLTVGALGSLGSLHILIGLGALATWAVGWLAPSEFPTYRYRPIPVLVAMLVAATTASYLAATLRPLDAIELSAADRGLITILAGAGIGLLIADSVRSRARLDDVVKAIVLAGAFIAVIGIIQFVTGADPAGAVRIPGLESPIDTESFILERSVFRRVAGTTSHPIEFSAVLCIVLPLSLHLALRHGRKWLVPTAVIAIALPMSVSRTAVLGLIAATVFLVPSWRRGVRRRFYVGAALYLVVMRLLVPGLLGTIRALFKDAGADPSVQTRRTDYEFVAEFVSSRPFFGRGFFTFIPTRYDFLDNQYLMSLVETGFFGVAAFILVLVGSMLTAHGIRRHATDPRDQDLAQALVASIAVVLATAGAFDFLSFSSARSLMFIVIGCVGGLWRLASTADPENRAGLPSERRASLSITPNSPTPLRTEVSHA